MQNEGDYRSYNRNCGVIIAYFPAKKGNDESSDLEADPVVGKTNEA